MKTIEKENNQIFEVYTNRKEFSQLVKDTWLDQLDNIWNDEDSSLTLIYKDGSEIHYTIGDKKQPLKLNDIIKGCYSNPSTYAIYNCEIIHNEKYNDYEVNI